MAVSTFKIRVRWRFYVDDGPSHVAFDFKSLHESFTFDAHGTPSGTIDSVIVSTDGRRAYTISHMAASFDQVLSDLATSPATMIARVLHGKDTIIGSKHDDTLAGFDGKDSLEGGKGRDEFLFNTAFARKNANTIEDFKHNTDTIAIEHTLIGAPLGATLRTSAFHIGSEAADKSDRFIYDDEKGKLYFDADGTGGAHQILVAILKDAPTFDAYDLLVV